MPNKLNCMKYECNIIVQMKYYKTEKIANKWNAHTLSLQKYNLDRRKRVGTNKDKIEIIKTTPIFCRAVAHTAVKCPSMTLFNGQGFSIFPCFMIYRALPRVSIPLTRNLARNSSCKPLCTSRSRQWHIVFD